ncbi:MAG: PQQ-binding-like beta-propeller repeat protein [Candidatus Lokiarchaeota archaeon]|nr:PQQ-binding-like beta-propeller repeat protein [Candidatus Lokiarchaeota archaeon]
MLRLVYRREVHKMKMKLLTLIFLGIMLVGPLCVVPTVPMNRAAEPYPESDNVTEENYSRQSPEGLLPRSTAMPSNVSEVYPSDYDIGNVLADRPNDYKVTYEPWRSKAAIHAVAYDEATGFLALGGGYLYDNQVHIFRLNTETGKYDKVWDTGGSIIQGDVLDLDFGDTDLNDFLEIVAASADGHVYVFEQRHLYDPYANTENMFDLVWTSPSMFRAFSVKVDDIDRDYRPDIIAGGWDGKVHLYEYDNHSGYPFVEEHWITYDEVSTLDVGEKVYTLETGDTNENGLPEIIVGTRDGTVLVYENDGVSIMINGYPFPLINDNRYYLNWTSQNYTWTPIQSMAVGELDGTLGNEIALVAQGQGLFTLDWNEADKTYDYKKVYKDFEAWETFGYWGLDFWADSVVSANNVTYHDPYNSSINVDEPINYQWGGSYFLPNASVYPYNTGMAMEPDGNYSAFDASIAGVDNATAIVDFGKDEEGTGSASDDADVWIYFRSTLTSSIHDEFNFSVSQDGSDFEQVSNSSFIIDGNILKVDVDGALARREWDYFRYVKLSVYEDGFYEVNSLQLKQVYNLITDALSVTIGPLAMDGDALLAGETDEMQKILLGTVVGEFIGVEWNQAESKYGIVWESGDEDRYTMEANVWDIMHVSSVKGVPTWRHLKAPNPSWSPPILTPPGGMEYNSWSYGCLDPWPYGEGRKNYFLGTKDGEIRAYNMLGEVDGDITSYLDPINDPTQYHRVLGQNHVSVEAPWLWSSISGWPMIALGSYDPEAEITGISNLDYRARIRFFYRSDAFSPFNEHVDLVDLDINGELSQQINYARNTPKMDFVDIDGDGDKDMVVSNGYVYLGRNTRVEHGGSILNFTLVRGYFEDVNDVATSRVWGQPEMWDLDEDGDLDLILSYGNKNGATCFLNEGTNEEPRWVEDKRIFSNPGLTSNMNYLNLTDVRIVPTTGGYSFEKQADAFGIEVEDEYSMVSYNTYTTQTWWAEPEYESIDTYMVATYPRVARLDFNLLNGTDYTNLGYRIHESWNNDEDLDNWTLAISSGDIDGDGNGEMIVGDYDNNVYAFEHLVNNTYKRMFRSFDLNYTLETDTSPYYYEELEGISGDFMRRVWNHAEHLVTDCDLDQDGLKEIVVGAGLQIYIFEDKNLTGGDQLEFAYEIDLRSMDVNDTSEWNLVKKITAMAAGKDIDYDGQNELAVAAGPFLFIFNVPIGTFDGTEDNDYFVTSQSLAGRYFLVGNPLDETNYDYAEISAMVLCDTDKDGYREVIIGGTIDTRLDKKNGFVFIYECQGGTFYKAWEAPEELTYWNPVSVLTLDDQDYDGNQEIVVGHTHGFDLWEWIPGSDSEYQKVEHVTASPNYPKVKVRTVISPVDDAYVLSSRAESDIVSYPESSSNIALLTYVDNDRLMGKAMQSNGIWTPEIPWVGPTYFTYPNEPLGPADDEMQPDMVYLENGDFYMTWKVEYNNGTRAFWIVRYDSGTWYGPYVVRYDVEGDRYYPRIVQLNSTHLLWMYVRRYGPTSAQIWCSLLPNDLNNLVSGPLGSGDYFVLNFKDYTNFVPYSFDAVDLPSDYSNRHVGVAFSSTNPQLSKPDKDIYMVFLEGSLDLDKAILNATAHQATTSMNEQMFPNIDYLRNDDETMFIAYENVGAPFENSLGMVSSTTKGSLWSFEKDLNTIPEDVVRTEEPDGSVTYERGAVELYGVRAYAPTVVGRKDGGFIQVNAFTAMIPKASSYIVGSTRIWIHGFISDFVYGVNSQSDWAYNHLRDVTDLDVGDTDQDGRREVVVGFDHQVGVYELKHSTNSTSFMSYEESWLSNPYDEPVTGVTVYDSNGNGFEEIGISTQRGDVYLIEFPKTVMGVSTMEFSKTLWSNSTGDGGNYGHWNSLSAVDIDSDGKDEIFAAEYDGSNVYAFEDDGEMLWNSSEISEPIREMFVEDLDNDGVYEVICASQTDAIHALDVTDGHELWNFSEATGDMLSLALHDITGDNASEILAGDATGKIWILDAEGNHLYNASTGHTASVYEVTVGNFTGEDHLTIAYLQYSGLFTVRLGVLNPFNGTVVYESPADSAILWSDLAAYDFNDNGIDDIAYGLNYLHIVDPSDGSVYYNGTISGFAQNFYIDNFDDDAAPELLVQTVNGAYLEDVVAGHTKWVYSPPMEFMDSVLGEMGGSDSMDLAMAGDSGVLVVLDTSTGVPIWFNVTGGQLWSITAAHLEDDGFLSPVAWDDSNGDIFATHHVIPTDYEEEPTYEMHSVYWNRTLDEELSGIWVEDVAGDSRDEIVVTDDSGGLMLLNGTTSNPIWNVTLASAALDVSFGTHTGTSDLDLTVRTADKQVVLLDGDDGSVVFNLSSPLDHYISGHFSGEYSSTNAGDEIVLLYEKRTVPRKSYLVWYDRAGIQLYVSDVNVTNAWNQLVTGHFSGASTLDIAFGGYDHYVNVYNGSDGKQLWTYNIGGSIYGMRAGDVNGDSYDDIAARDSSEDITVVNGQTGGLLYKKFFGIGDIESFELIDLVDNDGEDDLVISYADEGVKAYDSVGTQRWFFNAPLVMSYWNKMMTFDDMDSDGHTDLVVMNHNYVTVISGEDAKLIWHYRSNDRNQYPATGHFHSISGAPDVVVGYRYDLFVVSGTNPAPDPPDALSTPELAPLGFPAGLVETSIVLMPIMLTALVIVIRGTEMKKRKMPK